MATERESQPIKMVVVGDGGVGKTSILYNYLNGVFPKTYEPTVYENHVGCFSDGDNDNHISFWDTAGQEEYARLRPLAYQDTTVFLICFDVTNRISFQKVSSKWLPEVRKYCGLDIPTVLVGTKTDLRVETGGSLLKHRDKQATPPYVTQDEAIDLARSEKMFTYCECSALLAVGCQIPVKKAVEAARHSDLPSNGNACCVIL